MTEELAKLAGEVLQMASRSGATDAVTQAGVSRSTEFTFRDGKVEQVQQNASRGLNLQLYVEGGYSTHHTSDLRPEQVRRFVQEAVALTRHLQPDPYRILPDPALYGGRSQADLDLVDDALFTLERDTCLEWLRSMDQIAHGDSRVISATSTVHFGRVAAVRVSSNGFSGIQQSTSIGYGSGVSLDEGNGRRPEASCFVPARHLEDLPDVAAVAEEALDRARGRLGSRKAASGRTLMVVDPKAGGPLLGRLGQALSAGAIQQQRSCLAGRQGQFVASERLTIVDEPLLVRGLGSRHFDGEGLAARPLPIFARGVLCNYYVDTYYGRKLGWQPTTGGPSNLLVELGEKPLADLLAEAGKGFYITGWAGGNADLTTGDFSFGFRGHRIEEGQPGAPVAEMNITGNYLELLQNLAAVGNDPYPYSSFRTPTLVFENVEFSGE